MTKAEMIVFIKENDTYFKPHDLTKLSYKLLKGIYFIVRFEVKLINERHKKNRNII